MTQILAVSKKGKDVLTTTQPNDLIFYSDYNSFKIVYQGTTAVTVTSANDWNSFAHNSPLANTSCILIFLQFPDGKVTPATYASAVGEAKSYNNAYSLSDSHSAGLAYWDNTNIYFRCLGVGTSYTINVAWFIFEASL